MRIKTGYLTGAALDWAVAQCEYVDVRYGFDDNCPEYSTDWAQGGPIIEREAISVVADYVDTFGSFVWFASVDDIFVDSEDAHGMHGPTPLIAAMRCYVGSKLGDEIEVPEEIEPARELANKVFGFKGAQA